VCAFIFFAVHATCHAVSPVLMCKNHESPYCAVQNFFHSIFCHAYKVKKFYEMFVKMDCNRPVITNSCFGTKFQVVHSSKNVSEISPISTY